METKDAVNNLAANTKATVLDLELATAQDVFSIKHEFENQSLATQLLLHNLVCYITFFSEFRSNIMKEIVGLKRT